MLAQSLCEYAVSPLGLIRVIHYTQTSIWKQDQILPDLSAGYVGVSNLCIYVCIYIYIYVYICIYKYIFIYMYIYFRPTLYSMTNLDQFGTSWSLMTNLVIDDQLGH